MSARPFEPKFMKLSVLTAALREFTPRRVRDADPKPTTRSATSGQWEKVRAA